MLALRHNRFIGGLQLGGDGTTCRPRRRAGGRAQMGLAQLVHEGRPHLRAAFLEQLGAYAELLRDGQIFAAPARHLRQDGQKLDALLGQAVDRLLLVAGVVPLGDDPLFHQPLHPVGQDVGGDALFRFQQQLPEMPPVAEYHVPDDQQTPFVTDHFEGEIDRTARSVIGAHGLLQDRNRLSHRYSYNATNCVTQS